MAIKKVVPGSLTEAYKLREGDFSPSLVGNQFTDPNAFFTLGNFAITSNFEGRIAKDFKLGEWSDYYNLNNLDMTQEQLDQMVSNNIFVRLNFDKTNLERYVYFGSFSKFLESEIQDVILKWPASLHISTNPIQPTTSRPSNINTVLDFVYDTETNKAYFKTPKSGVNNPYRLDFSNDSFEPDNIPQQIFNYVLVNQEGTEFVINNMTGSSSVSNYVFFEIEDNPFPTLTGTTFGKKDFHIKPTKSIRNDFFNNLSDFQKLMLDKLTIPEYTFIVDVPIKYDDGDIGFSKKSFTWPTTDGYNLDINTLNYSDYIEDFFKVASLYDQNKTDLVVRRLVSESIIEYDTEGDGTEATGQRVSKLLRIYGAEFDVVKKYINGISFANVVTYNKKDNTSDNLIKMMAKTLGFDVLLATSGGFSLLENDDPSDDPVFQGYSRSLSPKEIDIELWRRLVINAWWLFRSKGTRKVLEFFLKLFGINSCLVSMDELVYLAKDKLDLLETRQQFNQLLGPDFFDLNFNLLPFDTFGFPKTPIDTADFWFQNDGFWYNGGNESVIGNNPHYGPYDYGQRYWSKFTCFIEDFQPVVNINRTETVTTNYFNEYNDGTFTPNEEGQAFLTYGEGVPEFFVNPNDNLNVISVGVVEYGEENGPININDTGNTHSLRITFQAGESNFCNNCPQDIRFNSRGLVEVNIGNDVFVPHDIEECCDFYWLPQETISTPVDPIGNVVPSSGGRGGTIPEEDQNRYYCWWCPPESSITLVCDSQDFLNNLNLTGVGIIDLASSYGYSGFNAEDAAGYLINIFNTYFVNGNCLFMVDGGLLRNSDCCTLRGGVWNEALNLCEIPAPPDPCSLENVTSIPGLTLVGQLIDNTQPVSEFNLEVLSQSCCESLGYYYGNVDPSILNIDGSTTTNNTVNILESQVLENITPAGQNPEFGCFECPTEYQEIELTNSNGETIITITELGGSNISESCCTSLGYEHTILSDFSQEPICLKCVTTPILNEVANTVLDLNGNSLDEECCIQNGYYYYGGNEIDSGCYICPPFVEGSYSIESTTINGVNYNLLVDQNGETLSPNCCTYYQEQSGNPNVVYAESVGCIIV